MKDFAPAPRAFEALSRELWLVTDRAWNVLWADERARSVLGVAPGSRLIDKCAPGADEKLHRLASELNGKASEPWELVLTIDGKPRVLAFRAQVVEDDRVALVGSLVPEDYAQALVQISDTLSEMAALHRETDRQQRELLRRHEEIVRANRDLDDSAKGVVALHAEIGEKEDSIRRAGEVKTRLVANVSHELRTPINSILGLTKLLLARIDGDLTEEQEKQLSFVKQSAESLYALVDDLLDLSKMEAGKVQLRAERFDVTTLLASLRGMLKPIASTPGVDLVVDDPKIALELETDEGKIAQILRNLVTNGLKFTERGHVKVSVAPDGPSHVVFTVEDTGIGVAPDELEKIFDEFYQVDSPAQRRSKGTGLGLSLSRHLAEYLGGSLVADSDGAGKGTRFILRIPRRHPEVEEMKELAARSARAVPGHQPILVLEDDRQTLFLYEKYLRGSGFHVIPARSVEEARNALAKITPAAIVLDVMLDGETSWQFLRDLKNNETTRDIPTLVVTVTNREERARALGADEFHVKPLEREWLVTKLKSLSKTGTVERVLVIDDDQVARYLVKKHLAGLPYEVIEAAGGLEGVRLAKERNPNVIFLDFVMPEMSAFDVLDELKKDPVTRCIPVIIHTSKTLAEDERRRLEREASAILQKQSLSREVAIARIRDALHQAGIRGSSGGGTP